MARFKTILTNQGAAALTLAMYQGNKVSPDFAQMGSGIFDGPQATVTELVEPVAVDVRVMDREFVEADGDTPSMLQISVQTFNTGLTELTPIREILLYANTNGGTDMTNAIPFAYGWLDGPDTDNILPPPLMPGIHDTIHLHELALFVTNQEAANIEVKFAFHGFVTHRFLQERLEEAIGLIPDAEDLAVHNQDPNAHHGRFINLQEQINELGSMDLEETLDKLQAILEAVENNDVSDDIVNMAALLNNIIDVLGAVNHAPSPTGSLMGRTAEMLNRLATLLERLTDARAGNLDRLDTTISSRAPANTAVSTAQWTNARAGNLDNLNQNLTTVIGAVNATGGTATTGGANAKLNALLGRPIPGARPRVQRGSTAAVWNNTTDVTINSVALAHSTVNILSIWSGGNTAGSGLIQVFLQNSTTLRIIT